MLMRCSYCTLIEYATVNYKRAKDDGLLSTFIFKHGIISPKMLASFEQALKQHRGHIGNLRQQSHLCTVGVMQVITH